MIAGAPVSGVSGRLTTLFPPMSVAVLRRDPSCFDPSIFPASPASHPVNAFFLKTTPFGRGAASIFDRILQDRSLLLADRVGLACMFLTPLELKTFLAEESARYERSAELEGVLLLGISPRGMNMLEVSGCRSVRATSVWRGIRSVACWSRALLTWSSGMVAWFEREVVLSLLDGALRG